MLSQNATVMIKRGSALDKASGVRNRPAFANDPVFVAFIDALLSLATRKMIAQNVRD